MLNTVNSETAKLMVIPFFFQGKADEIINIFKRADPQDKQRALELLQRLDITNAAKYKQELK
jgi:ABC-type phosphate/phosphonate transport system ATPase subunit